METELLDRKMTIDCFVADIRHNKLRVNPLSGQYIGLTEVAIRRYEDIVKSDEDRQVRLHGKFRYLAGRVWKSWDRYVHTFDRKRWVAGEKGVIIDGQPPQHWPRMMVIDPHDGKPHALLWIAKDPEYDLKYVYREGWLIGKTFKQVCEFIRDQEVDNRDKVTLRIMDPNMGPKMQGNNKTEVRDDFQKESQNIHYPMSFIYGDDHEALGRKRVEEMFYFDINEPISIINRPELYVANDLTQCIYQIEHYIWPDRDESLPDPRVEKPVQKNDDFPACMRYMALYPWRGGTPVLIPGFGNAYK